LTVGGIAVTSTNSGEFTQTNTCGSSLAAGANCTMSVTFKPPAAGTRTATVSSSDNVAGSPQIVSLTGKGTTATTSLSPTSLTFGRQNVGTTSVAQSVILRNTGNAALCIRAPCAEGR